MQDRVGVRSEAGRLEGMLSTPNLSGGFARFLAERELALMAGRDAQARLWVSPLVAPAGFLVAGGQELVVRAVPGPGDPLSGLPSGQPVGLVAIDLATRRRVRVNGALVGVDDGAKVGRGSLQVAVDQAYGNCPQYIQRRQLLGPAMPRGDSAYSARWSDALTAEDVGVIQAADTFFLGTTHPERGVDASHRGGTPGCVRVTGGELWWPDYPGNNMFNSLGNLAVDDAAALLFVDFVSGETVQLSGSAVVEWVTPDSSGDDGGTGRRVRFRPRWVVRNRNVALRAVDLGSYPGNPARVAG
jgi:hypothetical protein